MRVQDIPRKVWQFLSFIFVLYGFYLFFLFVWDTMVRVNEGLALPVAVVTTLLLMGISALLWARKHLKRPASPVGET